MKKYLFIYIILIIIFWHIYWLIYNLNSSSFIFEKQYNQNTISRFDVWHYINSPETYTLNLPEDIYDFNQSIYNLEDSLKTIYIKIDLLKKELNKTQKDSDSIVQLLNKSRSTDIEKELFKYLKLEKDSLNKIQNIIKIILENDSINGKEYIAESRLLVKEAELRYKIAIKKSFFWNNILNNYGSYGDKTIHKKFSDLTFKQNTLTDSIHHMEILYRKIGDKYANKIINFHNKRNEQIGYIDFLYFSVMTAFSNNLGDIIPNNYLARFFIALQVILSIIIISIILNNLQKRNNDNNKDSDGNKKIKTHKFTLL